ncbi:MAG: hypothetical protein LC662_08575, partial [Rhodothermaceae bacterium]|nr:hypothetical protein [Rhodothermaceae bacterium]
MTNTLKQAIVFTIACFSFITAAQPLCAAETEQDSRGAVYGVITDAETDEPVGWTSVLIEEVNR